MKPEPPFVPGRRTRTHPYGHGARPLGVGSDGAPAPAPVARPDLEAVPVAVRAYVEQLEREIREKDKRLTDYGWADYARQQARSGGTM